MLTELARMLATWLMTQPDMWGSGGVVAGSGTVRGRWRCLRPTWRRSLRVRKPLEQVRLVEAHRLAQDLDVTMARDTAAGPPRSSVARWPWRCRSTRSSGQGHDAGVVTKDPRGLARNPRLSQPSPTHSGHPVDSGSASPGGNGEQRLSCARCCRPGRL